ncbi:MAG TPA: TraR/DksA C4-type zinc finger protein [Ktedonobacterales bacterium]
MANYDEATVRRRLMYDLAQIERDIFARTRGEQAITPSEGLDGTGVTSEQADEGAALTEFDRNQAMLSNDYALQAQINAALQRLDAGKYGICERCGKEISARRLEALPYATLCVEDQAIVEQEGARPA